MRDQDTSKLNPDGGVNTTHDSNRDPITGAPGSHPVGTGVGAAAAGATGAAIGAAAGPIGAVVGAVVGAVAGGLAGKGIGEAVNPTEEDNYWRNNYRNRPYVQSGTNYEEYRPAYEHGWRSYSQYQGKPFDDVEPDVRSDWERRNPNSDWERAKGAVKDSFERVGQKVKSGANRAANAVQGATTDTRRDLDNPDFGDDNVRTQDGRSDVRRVDSDVRRADANVP